MTQTPEQVTVDRVSALLDAGQPEQALAVAKDLVSGKPEDATRQCALSAALMASGDVLGAQASAEAALAHDTESAWGHRLLGEAFVRQGFASQALAPARRAVELDPTDAESHLVLSVALQQLHRNEDALRALKTAAELDPTNPATVDAIASMTRHEWLPMPSLARMFPFFLFPGLIVALARRRSWRQRERILPQLVAAEATWSRSRRQSVRLVLLAIGCVASFACLAAFAGAVVLNAQWAYLTLGGSAVLLLAYQLVEVQVFR